MKILYVKNNSERDKNVQLQTIIYEKDGCKYVKKQVLNDEAIPHLKKIKANYEKLSSSIINPKIKLAKIIKETEDSLTFEYIEGLSLEEKFKSALKSGVNESNKIVTGYIELIKTGFKTTLFNSLTMATYEYKQIFGDFNTNIFDGDPCFNAISNIDLTFSNIIFKNNDIYLIDYEWVFDYFIPIKFSLYRGISPICELNPRNYFSKDEISIFKLIESHFLFNCVVGKNSFFQTQNTFSKNRMNIQNLEEALNDKDKHIQNLEGVLNDKDKHIQNLEGALNDKDKHIQNLERTLNDKDKHIQNFDGSINEKNKCIKSLEERYNNNCLILQQIYTSKSWKLITHYRTLKHKFKFAIKFILKTILPKKILDLLKIIKENPSLISKFIKKTQKNGIKESLQTANQKLKDKGKILGYVYLVPELTQTIKDEILNFQQDPLISIIMPVYNVDPKWLNLAIDSIEKQWYENWELCIVDDKSTNQNTTHFLKTLHNKKIKIKFLKQNLNISWASNECLKMASGQYVALMDNDDEITPNALYEVVKAINNTNCDFIYSDEDKLTLSGSHCDPHFKPDFAPDLFLSQNYISHLSVIRKKLIDKVGCFVKGLEGSQDYDLYLRVLEHTDKVHHISKVLYHWRKIPGSTAAEFNDKSYAQEAGVLALQNAMSRRKIKAEILNGKYPGTYRVKYKIKNSPLVSIIIPFKDKPELLTMCIESILEKSTYKNFEIIGISNNSTQNASFVEMKRLESLDSRVKFYEYNVPFNYSKINNYAVETYAKGDHIILLNNDVEIITQEWIESMLEFSQRKNVGSVGAKLYYPNNTIQHAGISIGVLTLAGHNFKHHPKNIPAYMGRESVIQNISAVTAACLMVKKSIFTMVNGLNEENLKIAFNDVDFCLRIQEIGYLNIYTPYCEAYHHESITRGYDDTKKKQDRFNQEINYIHKRHKNILKRGDPYYNVNLTLEREDFSLKPTEERLNTHD